MRYRKVLSVDFQHKYFAGMPEDLLRFEPIVSLEQQKRKCTQFLRPERNGFAILEIEEEKKGDTDNSRQKSVIYFDTGVFSDDLFFNSYSNLDQDFKKGQIYFVGNLPAKLKSKEKEKRITLTDQNAGKSFEAVEVWLRPRQFVFPIDNAGWKWYKLSYRNGQSVRTWNYDDNKGVEELFVDLSQGPAGLYYLENDRQLVARFYVSDTLVSQIPIPSFIIGIDLPISGDGKTGGKKGTGEKTPEVAKYLVEVSNRNVYWHYHVIVNSNHRELSELTIKNKNNRNLQKVVFKPHHIDQQIREAVFVSDTPIPMTEEGYKDIELLENEASNVPLIQHMPNAETTSLHMEEDGWVSRIYVNI